LTTGFTTGAIVGGASVSNVGVLPVGFIVAIGTMTVPKPISIG